jgi:hypothetical protein
MDSGYDVYNYDKSQFFTLLESTKFRAKYNLIQEQQGIIVCPLDLIKQPAGLASQADLIDRHLFVPSPFYKNHFIPLITLNQTNATNQSVSSSSSSSSGNLINTYSINLNPLVYLIVALQQEQDENENVNATGHDFYLIRQSRQICKHVKLLNVQTAYSESNKQYKILIVDKELFFKISIPKMARNKSSLVALNQISEQYADNAEKSGRHARSSSMGRNTEEEDEDDFEEMKNRADSQFLSESNSNRADKRRVSVVNYTISLNSVFTFQQSIDFMYNTVFMIDEAEFNDENAADFDGNYNSYQRSRKLSNVIIGEYLLSEVELFKKTYIILPTHLTDCAGQLTKIHDKYLRRFLSSFSIQDNKKLSESVSDIDLIISIACENTIIGCMYAKLWPCILNANKALDEALWANCKKIKSKLALENSDEDEAYNQLDGQQKKRILQWANFFQVDKLFFCINFKPILKEVKKLAMLNNPFQSMNCIKTCIDLLSNELSVSQRNAEKLAAKSSSTSCVVTSETLIPLLAFILVRSNMECLKSIVYFIDVFNFTSQPSSYTNACNSILISELSFFMVSFKAAIQVIEHLSS